MDAFNRCVQLGGKVKVKIVNPDTDEKRRVCYGAVSKHPKTGKPIKWGPVAEGKVYKKK